MLLAEAIYAAANSLFDGRLYPDEAPENTPRPFGTYQIISGRVVNTLAGPDSQRNARVQFNVWAYTRLGADQLTEQLRATIVDRSTPAALHGIPLAEAESLHEADTNWYGSRTDFSLWFSYVAVPGS